MAGIPQVKQLGYVNCPINKHLLLSVSKRGWDLVSGKGIEGPAYLWKKE
jgi:hypothetical protein